MKRIWPVALLLVACRGEAGDDGSTSTAGATEPSGDSGASASSSSSSGSDEAADAESGAPTFTGEEFFGMFCEPCHGFGGLGSPFGYELRHPVREHARWVIRNGRPGVDFPSSTMAPFAPSFLPDPTLEEILDYLHSFPQPTTGEALLADYCGNCHGADGTGGAAAVGITGTTAEIIAQARAGQPGDVADRTTYMPAFDAATLSDAELTAIAEFVGGP